MARSKAKPPVQEIEPEEVSQEEPEEFLTPEQPIATRENLEVNGTPSKAEMVRIAMADGLSKPGDIAAFIKARFQTDIPKPMVSSYAAQQRARERKAEGGEVTPRVRTASTPQSGIPAGFSSDVKELRELIEKAGGADELKELIGQLSGLIGKYGAGGLSELIDAIG